MFAFIKDSIQQRRAPVHFTNDERNLLSVAFKNLVTPKRTTWRTILAVEQSGGGQSQQAISQYKAIIEERLHRDCEEIVKLVQASVMPKLQNNGGQVKSHKVVEEYAFFYKMIGDYYRYASEAASWQVSKE